MTAPTMSLDEFRARAAQLGLTLGEDDLRELHQGHLGLLALMERFPRAWAWEAEAASVFAPLGGKPR